MQNNKYYKKRGGDIVPTSRGEVEPPLVHHMLPGGLDPLAALCCSTSARKTKIVIWG